MVEVTLDDYYILVDDIPEEYEWLVRDRNGNLWAFENEPSKNNRTGEWVLITGFTYFIDDADSDFDYITWDDEHPWNVKELIEIYAEQEAKVGLTFGEALEALKEGKKVTREVWKGYWAGHILRLDHREENGKYTGDFILSYLADGETVAPAQPYQEDLLAEDWKVLD